MRPAAVTLFALAALAFLAAGASWLALITAAPRGPGDFGTMFLGLYLYAALGLAVVGVILFAVGMAMVDRDRRGLRPRT